MHCNTKGKSSESKLDRQPGGWARIALIPVAVLLSACATQGPGILSPQLPSVGTQQVTPAEQTTLRTMVTLQDRLYRVAGPLLVANPELCKGNARNLLGFTAKTRHSFSADLANAAQVTLGLDDRLQVMGVLPGSGAAKAGVRKGDKIVSIEDKLLPQGPNAERDAAALLAPIVANRSSVRMAVSRDGATIPLTVPLTRACAYSVELGNSDNVNAYNDGRRVMVTRGMMNVARNDDELAYVLAKEMAHNSLQHARRQNMSGTVGAIIENLIRIQPDMSAMAGSGGIRPMPQDMDAAADTLSLYMLARAGYRVDGAARFWERLAAEQPASVPNGYTAIHPSTSYRLAVMEKIVADVKSKQAKRQPLLP